MYTVDNRTRLWFTFRIHRARLPRSGSSESDHYEEDLGSDVNMHASRLHQPLAELATKGAASVIPILQDSIRMLPAAEKSWDFAGV